MRVLIDTNIILDVLMDRKQFVDASQCIFNLCELKEIEGHISALTIPNLVYIMRKELNRDRIKDILHKLSMLFQIDDLKTEDISQAINLPMNDFEDALQSACAARIEADYIITRNGKDFANSLVKPITPNKFLLLY